MKKKVLILIFLIISSFSILFTVSYMVFFALPPEPIPEDNYSPSTEYNIIPPTLDLITPSTDGNIRLDWDDAEVINSDLLNELIFSHYRVLRSKDSGVWREIETIYYFDNVEYYNDYGLAEGIYKYKIQLGFYKPVVIEMHYSEYSNVQPVEVDIYIPPINPSILINGGAITTDSLKVTLTLYCKYATKMQFEIYGNLLNFIAYSETHDITFCQEGPDYPIYKVGVIFGNEDGVTGIIYDEITHVNDSVVEVFPSNPSIIINDDGTDDGANNTNSFENILTLSCDDATEMQFKINEGAWTNWITYAESYTITLPENDLGYPDYRVEVIFRNSIGTTKDAGYTNIYDDIIYDPEGNPPPLNGDDKPVDYTLLAIVLLGVLVSLIGIGVFLKYRKQIIKTK